MIQYGDAYQFNPPKNGDFAQRELHTHGLEILKDRRAKYRRLRLVVEDSIQTDFENIKPSRLDNLLSRLYEVYFDLRDFPSNSDIFKSSQPYGLEMSYEMKRFLPYWKVIVKLAEKWDFLPNYLEDFMVMHSELENFFSKEPELDAELDLIEPIIVETEM